MSSPLRHRKKRNVGLVHEFLVRRMASQLLAEDRKGYVRSLSIFKKYFSSGCPLRRELDLYDAVRRSRGVSAEVARGIISRVLTEAKRPNRLAEASLRRLVTELTSTFGTEIFDHRIPEYRTLASLSILIDDCRRPGRLNEAVELLHLTEELVRYMTSPNERASFQTTEIDNLTTALAAKKFRERYKHLGERANKLLEKYVALTVKGDSKSLRRVLLSERDDLQKTLQNSRSTEELKKDPVMMERFTEEFNRLGTLNLENDDIEGTVGELLLYGRLVEELRSDA